MLGYIVALLSAALTTGDRVFFPDLMGVKCLTLKCFGFQYSDLDLRKSKIAIITIIHFCHCCSPETIRNFNRAGTIADFIVAMLCDADMATINPQNAASWGYFNCQKNKWNLDILQAASFPVHLLPNVLPSGTIAGELQNSWHNIPKGTPIGKMDTSFTDF